MTRRVAPEPEKRHSGEMYDAVWSLPSSALTIDGVKPGTARHVLMAAARRTNPTRDRGRFEWFASAETIASDAEVNVRTVQRVFGHFADQGWLEIVAQGVRDGHPRIGEEHRRGWRAPRWRACLELWPVDDGRQLKGSRDVRVVTTGSQSGQQAGFQEIPGNTQKTLAATGDAVAATWESQQSDGDDAGVADVAVVTTRTSPKPGSVLTRNNEIQPVSEPASRARKSDQEKDESRHHGYGESLPGMQAMGLLSANAGTTHTRVPGSTLETQVPAGATCPGCHRRIQVSADRAAQRAQHSVAGSISKPCTYVARGMISPSQWPDRERPRAVDPEPPDLIEPVDQHDAPQLGAETLAEPVLVGLPLVAVEAFACPSCAQLSRMSGEAPRYVNVDGEGVNSNGYPDPEPHGGHFSYCEFRNTGRRAPDQWPREPEAVAS